MNRNLIFAAVFAATSGVACAGETPESFSNLDADQDGSITQEEALNMPNLTSQFKDLDEDADGRLNEAEFSKFEVDAESPAMDSAPEVSPEQGIDGGTEVPGAAPSGEGSTTPNEASPSEGTDNTGGTPQL